MRDLDVKGAMAGWDAGRTEVRVDADPIEGKLELREVDPVIRGRGGAIETEVQVEHRHVPQSPSAFGELPRQVLDLREQVWQRHRGDQSRVTEDLAAREESFTRRRSKMNEARTEPK